VVVLRRRHPEAQRPFKVPGGRIGLGVCFTLIYLWVLLGAWQTVAPGLLQSAFGLHYDFVGTWGISRTAFELFTFGTLAAIALFGLAGYAGARRGRTNTTAQEETTLAEPVAP
jgi:hypothetical protein